MKLERDRCGSPRTARIHALASKPTHLLQLAHASQRRLAAASPDELHDWMDSITIALGRERAKSTSRHWSYDLNRHIGLKAARDRVRTEMDARKI